MENNKIYPINIVIIDDSIDFLEGFKAYLELNYKEYINEIFITNENIKIEELKELDAKLYFIDYEMKTIKGYEIAKLILDDNQNASVIGMSLYNEPQYIERFLLSGATAFIRKEEIYKTNLIPYLKN